MPRSLFLSLPVALAVGLALPLACGAPFTTGSGAAGDDGGPTGDGATDTTQPDAPGTDATPFPDGPTTDGTAHDASPETAPPPGTIVYVSSATGLDTNAGTDSTKPKKSIASALVKAQAIGAAAQVHVCAGLYQEASLTLAQSIPLLGSYDCTTWARSPGYGYPTFDGINATVISNAASATQAATLVVAAGVTASGIVDGFVVAGAGNSTGPTSAIQVVGASSPRITNDGVSGGVGSGGNSNAGSVGIDVGGGSPVISGDSITGGSGAGNPGSVGIYVRPGSSPVITGDLVTGGTGTAAASTDDAAVGIVVSSSLTQSSQLKNVAVLGTDKAGAVGSSTGIFIGGSTIAVDIVDCAIEGGSGSGDDTVSTGVVVADPSGTTRVLSSRIYGGTRSGASSQTFGVYVAQAAEVDVENDEIHGGEVGSSGGSFSAAVSVSSSMAATIVDDTLYAGPGPGAAISVASGVVGVTVTDDMLVGGGVSGQFGVSMGACSGQLKTLDHTAFANLASIYACGGQSGISDVPTMATDLPGVSTAGDFTLSSSGGCIAATSCVPDPSCPGAPSTCLASIFGTSWTSDDGVTGLFAGAPQLGDAAAPFTGWVLPAGTPCAIARGGTPYGGITTDLFGQLRDLSKPSIGAFEFVSPACK
jgi:hypothetical protein